MDPIGAFRSIGNSFGLAWWARVETIDPNVTYWFGPFLTRRSLNRSLSKFLDDLKKEGCGSLNHSFIRCNRSEPLTT